MAAHNTALIDCVVASLSGMREPAIEFFSYEEAFDCLFAIYKASSNLLFIVMSYDA